MGFSAPAAAGAESDHASGSLRESERVMEMWRCGFWGSFGAWAMAWAMVNTLPEICTDTEKSSES